MSTSCFSKTPTITVVDNRSLTVRDIAYYCHPDTPNNTEQRITHHQHNAQGFQTQSADPRLYEIGLTNFAYQTDLLGNVLCVQSADAGITLALNDSAGRPFMAMSNIGTTEHGKEDISQAVTHTFQYEDTNLLGRQISITEQVTDEAARITERFVWADNSEEEQQYNLVGQCVSHYDTAGLMQTNSIALSGIPLSVTRKLLKGADCQATVADWQGNDAAVWDQQLDNEPYSTQVTTDATGHVLTTIDARGNLQRMAYDVVGLLMSSWLTVKDEQEQVIVQSLTYSAAGQKLCEEHGNGVVTTYTYEPETQRLIGIKTERPVGHVAGAKVLQDLRYQYDPVGNLLNIRNDAEETRFWRNQKIVPENTYIYDSLYQLVNVTGREIADIPKQSSKLLPVIVPLPSDNSTYTNYSRSYSYDTAGNLTQIRHSAPATNNNYTISITISNRSNRGILSTLTEDPAEVEEFFTAAGNQSILLPGQPLNWTPRGELQKVIPVTQEGVADDNEHYRYAADSQRLLKITRQLMGSSVRGQRVQYLPGLELRSTTNNDMPIEILQVITMGETGRAQVRLLYWEMGEPSAIIGNSQLRYSYDNFIGSSCLEVDGDGFIISLEEYYPYGGTAVWMARSQIEADYKTILYSGKERDATGLYYYGYRYYQPWVGRWLSADPAGTVDGLNLYRMVGNNPVFFHDSNGLIKEGKQARQLVAKAFVHPLHMPIFERLSIKKNMAMSVREAGTYTITALGEGSAAKGHNILEKAIKPSSLKSVYGNQAEAVLKQAESSGFVGRVGQWNKLGVQGVYAHNKVTGDDLAYPINLQNSSDNELLNTWIKFKMVVPYTGDYDMHDIILYKGGKGSVPAAESAEEKEVKDLINQGVAEIDPSRPFNYTAMNVIRHGPQVNFVPYMWEYEQDKVINDNGYLGIVAPRPGPFPVAMVYQGEWTIYENSDELFDFYKSTNTSIPQHWQQEFIETGNGRVVTPIHAKTLQRLWQKMQPENLALLY